MAGVLVFRAGIGVLALLLLMLACIAALRAINLVRSGRRARRWDDWRPHLMAVIEGISAPPLRLLPESRRSFLLLWNHLHESLRGEATLRLTQFGYRLEIDYIARDLLYHASVAQRLLGVITAGNLADRQAWSRLIELLANRNPTLSISAARALMQINPRPALEVLFAALGSRADWPRNRVMSLLREADTELVSTALTRAILQANGQTFSVLLGYLELAHVESAAPLVSELLAKPNSPDNQAILVRLSHDKHDLAHIRRLCDSDCGLVRLECARALGRIGTPDDLSRVERLLNDEVWWVRYRAAQALLALARVSELDLTVVHQRVSPGAATAMFDHVLAEREFA